MNAKKIAILAATRTATFDTLDTLVGPYYDLERLEAPGSVEQIVQRVRASGAQAVVIESGSSDFDWVSAIHALVRPDKRPFVLVIGDAADRESLFSAFRHGADAYLPLSAVAAELLPALEAVEEGRVFYRQRDVAAIRDHMRYLELGSARNVADVQDGIARLTVREKEVFPLLADGRSIRETARTLGISPKTVETHKYNIMKKLHLETMADFTKLGMIKDLIPM